MGNKKTDKFRKNHDTLLQLLENLKLYLEADRVAKEAKDACRVVGKIAGLLIMNMAHEDKNLFPELLGSSNKQIKDAAEKFAIETKNVRKVADKFMSKWVVIKNVQAQPVDFIKDANTLITSLSESLEKKNTQFYDLVDKHAA
ncbi:MAG: hypothetical protein SGJ18_15490 [Pseudomonadota bacterium]|nr:hypothetical protein [Pseudomonadota bacterium]